MDERQVLGARGEAAVAAVLERREEILKKLGQDYGGVLLDLEVRNGA